ncbi:uncharacterized protein BDW43DRAFT_301743 [Aspergillus alliaceus]|uniref:uncharacterized protein n=1 Tax=Petromyces alliaceus TaxID=209559 RepID=UPI0012A5C8D0|nr:uncharacterized protein BDW43DRAFT_301743 [Aspergillus alliaceus]KAB8231560.1 hypothetical protein BDW43DRAFT_301743 [Aspergillus alliaceus]
MPVFIVDGERHRIPFMSCFRGSRSIGEKWFTYNAEIRVKTPPKASISDIWSAQDDTTLQNLRHCSIPWKYISAAMNNRPVEDLKKRWASLHGDRLTKSVDKPVKDTINDRLSCKTLEGGSVERHVCFSDPLVTEGDTEDDNIASKPSKVKHVFYTDENFDLEDVLLLHTIAAKWERDKWLNVSTRFNDRTGRNITPEDAKSMIDLEGV